MSPNNPISVHSVLNTSSEKSADRLTVLKSSQYFLFRDSTTEQRKLIQLRVTSEGPAFIILSPREFPLWSTLYVEIKENEVSFGKYNGIGAKEAEKQPADLVGVLDLWFYFEGQFLYIGKQGNKTTPPETIVKFFSKTLPETNHMGLSNTGLGEWIIHEGRSKSMNK